MAEIRVLKSVIINVPAEDIFAYVCELENMVDWSSTTIAIRKTSSGSMGAGATIQSTVRFLGRWLNVVFEVIEYSPGRCLAFKSIAGSPPCLFCYQFEPVEGGATLTSEEAVMQVVDGVMDQSRPVVASAVARQVEYDLLTLKDILESGRDG